MHNLRPVPVLVVASLAALLAVSATAQEALADATTTVPAATGRAQSWNVPFVVPGEGPVRVQATVAPFCLCDNPGFQYFRLEHRLAGSSDWVAGFPAEMDDGRWSRSPEPAVDGAEVVDTWEWVARKGAERYELRLVGCPNFTWDGVAVQTPEQTLGVKVLFGSAPETQVATTPPEGAAPPPAGSAPAS